MGMEVSWKRKMTVLDEIYAELPESRWHERYIVTSCISPEHDDRHPSMLIYPDKYHCLSCGIWGKTSDLLNQLQSHSIIPPKPIQTFIRNPFNSWLKRSDLFNVLKTAYRALKSFPQQGSYLYKRGLDKKLIEKLKIGYLDGWYTIPIIGKDKKPLGSLARAGESIMGARYFVPRGQDTNLLFSPDWQQVKESNEVYLTFGVFDAIAIHQCGRPSMSTTSGKRLHPSALQGFRKRIKIFADRGEEVDAKRLANKLGWRGEVIKYKYPYGLKDPSDVYNAGLLQGVL